MGVIKKQGILTTGIVYLGVILGFLNIGILMPKFFTPAEIGLRSLLVDFTTLFVTFSFIGLNNGMIKFHSPFKKGNKMKGYFLYFVIVSSLSLLFFSSLLYFFQESILAVYGKSSALFVEYFPLVYAMAAFFILNMIFEAIFKCIHNVFMISFVKEVVLRVLFAILIVLYCLELLDFKEFIVSFVFSYLAIASILFFALLRNKTIDFKIHKVLLTQDFNKQLFNFSLTTFITSAAYMVVFKLDTLMIGGFLGSDEVDGAHYVGLYSMALFFVTTIDIPRRSLFQINTPLISQYFSSNELDKVEDIYQKTSNTLCVIGGLLLGLLIISFDLIIEIIPNGYLYQEIYWVVVYLSVSILIVMIFSVSGDIITYSKYYKYNFLFILFLMFFSVVSNYFLINNLGIIGAAIATVLSIFSFCMMKFIFIKNKFNFKLFDIKTFYIIMIIIVLTCVFNIQTPVSNVIVEGLIKIILFVILYLIMIFKFNLSQEINKIIIDVYSKLKSSSD